MGISVKTSDKAKWGIEPERLYSYFSHNFIIKKSSNGWWGFDCPFCIGGEGKKKHNVNFAYSRTKCWVCGHKGTILDFVMDYEDISYLEAKTKLVDYEAANISLEMLEGVQKEIISDINLPVGYHPILTDGLFADRARSYLTGRGFNLEALDAMGVGYCNEHTIDFKEDYFGYIIIPFKRKGQLVYFIGRDFMNRGEDRRYKNPAKAEVGIGKSEVIFNEDALYRGGTGFICEGWSDACTMGKMSTSTQGWSLSQRQIGMYLTSEWDEFVFIADAGFYKEAVTTAMRFVEEKKVRVVNLDSYEAAGRGKDANAIGKAAVIAELLNTPYLSQELGMKIMMN